MAVEVEDDCSSPRTMSGKRPTTAALQRERDYFDWLQELPFPPRDDLPFDDSWTRFMAERNKARLRDFDAKRREARWNAHGMTAPAERVDSRVQVQREWQQTCEDNGWPAHAVDDKEMRCLFVTHRRQQRERARLAKLTERRKAVREAAGPSGRKRGRPADPNREQRKRQQLELQVEKRNADATGSGAVRAAEAERVWFQTRTPATMGSWLHGHGRLCALRHQRWYRQLGVPGAALWWRKVAEFYIAQAHSCTRGSLRVEKVALAAARARAADAKALEVIALEAAAATADSVDAEAASAAAAKAVCVAAAARAAEMGNSAYTSSGQARGDADFLRSFEAALAAEGVTDVDARVASTAPKLEPLPTPARTAWSTEGQCEGITRDGERCKVHKSSKYAVAAPLRRGERYCGHHHPDKYTGVRCAGMKKHGKGRCRVWSGSCYADAAPLRRGSLFCHHHRIRCAGHTRTGTRCAVTSSCEHEHAEPLRRGELYCAHHRDTAGSANSDGFVLYDCDHCDYLCAVRVGEDPGIDHVCEC